MIDGKMVSTGACQEGRKKIPYPTTKDNNLNDSFKATCELKKGDT